MVHALGSDSSGVKNYNFCSLGADKPIYNLSQKRFLKYVKGTARFESTFLQESNIVCVSLFAYLFVLCQYVYTFIFSVLVSIYFFLLLIRNFARNRHMKFSQKKKKNGVVTARH